MEDSITEIRVLSDQEGGKPGYTPKKMLTGLAVGSYKSRKEKKNVPAGRPDTETGDIDGTRQKSWLVRC